MSRAHHRRGRALICLTVASSLVAAGLANVTAASAQTIEVPETLMRTVTFNGAHGRVALGTRPTHIGFSWRGSHGARVVYRTIAASGATSRWRIARPAHDMEAGNKSFSGLIEVNRPARVEYRKRLRKRQWMGAITMHSINTLDGPEREVTLRTSARSDPNAPPIITRAEWGADESMKRKRGGCKRTFHPVKQLFVHHTAGSNRDFNGAATMRAIYAYHVRGRGWCDLGYNFLIDWSGRIYEGRWARNYGPWETHDGEDHRNYAVTGAHVGNFNSGSVGISLMGHFRNVRPPAKTMRSLRQMLAWEVDRHDLNPTGTHRFGGRRMRVIAGHRDAGSTECPGDKLYNRLPTVRRKVKKMVGPGRTSSVLNLQASARAIRHGDSVDFQGFLTETNGAPLPNKTIALHRRLGRGAWRSAGTRTTGPDGGIEVTLTPGRNLRLAASFQTEPAYWGADSRIVAVGVKHAVTMAPSDRAPDADGVYHYSPGENKAVVRGRVDPPHAGKRVTLRLLVRPLGSSRYLLKRRPKATLDGAGEFTHTFTLPKPKPGKGYKVAARMPADKIHKRGGSGPSVLVVDPES